jgi:CDP-glycerol glycerophosphotransferase
MIKPRFTIVLLGYQSELYLPKAIASIHRQTFHDFDVMCIVEESTDASLSICLNWAYKDSNIKVVSLPKSGSGSCSRNYAIAHARGDYLLFIDGDDWIVDDMLEQLECRLQSTGDVDILAFAAVTTEKDTVDIKKAPFVTNFTLLDDNSTFSGLEAIRKTKKNGGSFHGYTWLNIYRTQYLRDNKLFQKPGVIFEDAEWMTRTWYFAKKFAYLHAKLYIYRRNKASIMSESSSRNIFDLVDNLSSVIEFAKSQSVSSDIAATWSNQWTSMLYWFMFSPTSSRKISDKDRLDALTILFRNAGKERVKNFISMSSGPKRLAAPLLFLAAHGWMLPAKIFFRWLYYPLVMRRG